MARPVMTDLMDDLAMDIHDYLIEVSVKYGENSYVLIPVTEVVQQFQRNHN